MEADLKNFVQMLFSIGGFAVKEVVVQKEGESNLRVDVFLYEAGLAIGLQGEYLWAWEKVIQKKALSQNIQARVIFDINNYRFQHKERLREIARQAAKKAVLTKRPVKLSNMNAYERWVIHTELALRPDVLTESIGDEPRRYVVVKAL